MYGQIESFCYRKECIQYVNVSDSPQPSSSYLNDIYFMMLMGLIPGPTEPKNTDPYVDVLVDAIVYLNEMTMYDAYKDEMFWLKANVVLHILDYPGQNKF